MHAILPLIEQTDFPSIHRRKLTTLQVNLGYLCNMSCLHCHVNAGPTRKEQMELETIEQILKMARSASIETIDLTGGAPELNPHFRHLVSEANASGMTVIDRCNLTILQEPGQQDLAEFLADNHVEISASLPCYLEENVDKQRGQGAFDSSIQGLQKLNRLGYGMPDTGLRLNLVFNPQGPMLPPPQRELREQYKDHLKEQFGIVFNDLYTVTNMPINRFGSTLVSKGNFNDYMTLLRNAFNSENLENLMCRGLISIDWQGHVYDCDFNQMLELPLQFKNYTKPHVTDLLGQDLLTNPIVIKDHCYGCTAGQGSSCSGALET